MALPSDCSRCMGRRRLLPFGGALCEGGDFAGGLLPAPRPPRSGSGALGGPFENVEDARQSLSPSFSSVMGVAVGMARGVASTAILGLSKGCGIGNGVWRRGCVASHGLFGGQGGARREWGAPMGLGFLL